MSNDNYLIVVCGPTASGKTRTAIDLALHFHAEIISADSRQIYREMAIGTAVPSDDERKQVPHHFLQTHSVHQYYNASQYEQEVLLFLSGYYKTSSLAILVGGSGLYIDAVCRGIDELPAIDPEVRKKWLQIHREQGLEYLQEKVSAVDPDYYAIADTKNPKRLLKALEVFEMTGKPYSAFLKQDFSPRPFHTIKVGLDMERRLLYQRINQRVERMMQNGLLEEARKLYPYKKLTALKTVGYKELFEYFDGILKLDEAVTQIKDHTRAYARRQITWFRRDKAIRWFKPDETGTMKNYIHNEINT